MILSSPLSIPPTPLAGPRKVGDDIDYIELDPAGGQINVAGAASPLTIQDLLLDIWRPPATGDYTTGMYNTIHTSGGTMVADRLYAIPCVLPIRSSYSDVSISVATGQAGANARMGVYADNGVGRPGALIEDAGTFTPTAAAFYDVAFAADLALGAGLVWLALVTDNASVSWGRTNRNTVFSIRTFQSAGVYPETSQVYVAHAFGALPDPFGSAMLHGWVSPYRLVLKGA